MRKQAISLTVLLVILGWTSLLGMSQETKQNSGKDVNVTVTVERRGPNAPAELKADDVFVYQSNKRRPVVRWVRAAGQNEGLDLAVLIDDSLDPAIGSHYGELKDFIRSLPVGTRVAITYATHGDAKFVQNFTTDHERAASAIRLPMGQFNETSSIYQALTDLVKHWPGAGSRRAVLVISDGVDLYWGVMEALPSNNPDLRRAVAAAQRGGVNVYSIFADTAGSVRQNAFLVNAGQSCLSLLALATGGKAYFQGLQTPIDFRSIFQHLEDRLGDQYLLTFSAEQGRKGSYDRLHLTTEQPDVELIAPSRVYVPGVESPAR